jgi:sporulation protein YtfJ
MAEHPIDNLMVTAMNSLRDMIDVNTIVGDTVQSADGTVIIPVSKVSFGFAAGGSEFETNKVNKYQDNPKMPFGGRKWCGSENIPGCIFSR